MKPLRIPKGRR